MPPGPANSQTESITEALIETWGGKRQFAKDLIHEYHCAPGGSKTRLRILEMVYQSALAQEDQADKTTCGMI